MYYKSNGMAGKEFNYLMATGVSQMPGNKSGKRRDEFECVCGRRKFIQPSAVVSGRTKSCGCLSGELHSAKAAEKRQARNEYLVISRDKQVWALRLFAGAS
jgi:hypothetical protein